jgi:hypothetical protein
MAGGLKITSPTGRELYVLVEGDEWAHMEALDGGHGGGGDGEDLECAVHPPSVSAPRATS